MKVKLFCVLDSLLMYFYTSDNAIVHLVLTTLRMNRRRHRQFVVDGSPSDTLQSGSMKKRQLNQLNLVVFLGAYRVYEKIQQSPIQNSSEKSGHILWQGKDVQDRIHKAFIAGHGPLRLREARPQSPSRGQTRDSAWIYVRGVPLQIRSP